MNTILDQTTDLNGQVTYKLTQQFGMPDFVKSASSEKLYGSDLGLSAKLYADPFNKLYPCHTKAATWLSSLFFLNNKQENKYNSKEASIIEQKIDKFAKYFNVSKEVDQLKIDFKKASSTNLDKLSDEMFALVFTQDNKKERYYPLRNGNEIKQAAAYIDQYKDVIPLVERQKMAQKILDRAESVGVSFDDDVSEFLDKQAGYGVCAASDAKDLIQNRIYELKKSKAPKELITELEKAASHCIEDADTVRQQNNLSSLAQIIDNLDRSYGFNKKYSAALPRPEDVLFGVTVKAASTVLSDYCTLTNGKIYKVADFRKIPLNEIRDLMGDEFADEVSVGGLTTSPEKLAEVASTLPRTDVAVLDRILNSVGIKPVAKEAAHYEVGIRDQLHEIAALR